MFAHCTIFDVYPVSFTGSILVAQDLASCVARAVAVSGDDKSPMPKMERYNKCMFYWTYWMVYIFMDAITY